MVDPQLLDYVKKEISKGFTLDQIKQMLLQYNYPESAIMEAFASLQQQPQQQSQSSVLPEQSVSPEQGSQSTTQSAQPEQASQSEQSAQTQQAGQEQAAQAGATSAVQQTPQSVLSKMQRNSLHYVYLLSGLILIIVIIQFATSSFLVPNLIKSLIFLFIAGMTVVYAKQRFVKPKTALFYKIFLVLDIIVLIGLIIALFK